MKNQDGENSETVYCTCGGVRTRLFAYKGIVIDGLTLMRS